MAMRILRLRKTAMDDYRIVVHIDDTKLDENGDPDPLYVARFSFPPKPTELTQAAYLQELRPLVREGCLKQLALVEGLAEGNALPGEGDPL